MKLFQWFLQNPDLLDGFQPWKSATCRKRAELTQWTWCWRCTQHYRYNGWDKDGWREDTEEWRSAGEREAPPILLSDADVSENGLLLLLFDVLVISVTHLSGSVLVGLVNTFTLSHSLLCFSLISSELWRQNRKVWKDEKNIWIGLMCVCPVTLESLNS